MNKKSWKIVYAAIYALGIVVAVWFYWNESKLAGHTLLAMYAVAKFWELYVGPKIPGVTIDKLEYRRMIAMVFTCAGILLIIFVEYFA